MNATTTANVCGADFQGEPIRRQLRQRMLTLNYHAFAQCLCLLLTRLGYEDARVAGRTGWKGRNREGGYDIEAWLPAGVGRRRVIAQAKQFDALPVFQRSVDELRGACLRAGAAEALLMTTSTFSPVIRPTLASSPVAPVRLLDGDGLLDLMLAHQVGVWEEAGETENEPRRVGVDEGFFDGLTAAFPLRHKEMSLPGTENKEMSLPGTEKPAPAWTVTVSVGVDAVPVTSLKGTALNVTPHKERR